MGATSTVMVPEKYDPIIEEIRHRVSELLHAQVFVIDSRGRIVSRSAPHPGENGHRLAEEIPTSCVRVPLALDGWQGEVVVGEPLNGEVISPRLARVIVELVVNQRTVVDRLPNQHQLKNQFIYDLLHGNVGDEAAVLRQANLLGMDLTPPRAVILIDASEYILRSSGREDRESEEARIQRRAQLVIGSIVGFFKLQNDTICAYIGNGEVAVLKASDTKNLVDWTDSENGRDGTNPSWANLVALRRAGESLLSRLRSDTCSPISIGIGRYHPGLQGLARSYQDACTALSLGRRLYGPDKVHWLGGLGVAALVGITDGQTKLELAAHLLRPLDHEPGLRRTLEAFFARDCCHASTAEQLTIHRNTLSYRLDKITTLTGLNPRHFDDAVQIRLALLLSSLDDQDPPDVNRAETISEWEGEEQPVRPSI